MSNGQIMQLAALALGLCGIWMVAFGLRIKEGIDPNGIKLAPMLLLSISYDPLMAIESLRVRSAQR
jgi:hypothetical protein